MNVIQKNLKNQVYTLVKKENDLIDWYSALRDFQGNLNIYKSGLKYMINSNDFIKIAYFVNMVIS